MASKADRLVPWIVYLIFFAVLNETVFNVSTPRIAAEFSLSASGVSWMMTIFMVFFGISTVIFGKLSDIYSLRRLILIGISVYLLGSVLGFVLRSSYALVIAARAIQGIGGSAIPALVFVVVARHYEASQRGRVFGMITSTVSLAIGLGPVIGGFVSAALHWSFLFLIPLFLAVSIPFFARELPKEDRRAGRIDAVGAFLLAGTVGSFVLWLNFPYWYLLTACAISLALFVARINSVSEPFIKPSLFSNVKFRNGVIVGFALFSVVIGILFVVPLMLSRVYGLDTAQIGLILFPGAMSSALFGPVAGSLADRRGNSFVVSLGLMLLITSMLMMAFWLSLSPLVVGAALLLTYTGFTLFQTAMINSVSQTLPPEETGVGMGLFNLVSIVSGAMGAAIVGRSLDGGWLDFRLLPVGQSPAGTPYSNLMLAFSVIVVAGGILYLGSYRGPAAPELRSCVEFSEC